MKNGWKSLIVITAVFILCISILPACNSPVNPNEEHSTTGPTDIVGGNTNDTTGPTQNQSPVSPDSNDSNFMDGNDHVAAPFG